MLTAWADESGSRPDLDPGAYLLAAVLCEDDDVAEIRKTMEGLRSSEPKLHWHGAVRSVAANSSRLSLVFRSPDLSWFMSTAMRTTGGTDGSAWSFFYRT